MNYLELADGLSRGRRSPQKAAPRMRMPYKGVVKKAIANRPKIRQKIVPQYIPLPEAPDVYAREDEFDETMEDQEFIQHLADCGLSDGEIDFLAGKRKQRKRAKKDDKHAIKMDKKRSKNDKKKASADLKRSRGQAKVTKADAKKDKANNPREKKDFNEIVSSVTGGLTAVVDSAGQVVQAWKGNNPNDPDAQVDPDTIPGAGSIGPKINSNPQGTINIMGKEITYIQAGIGAFAIGGLIYILTRKQRAA